MPYPTDSYGGPVRETNNESTIRLTRVPLFNTDIFYYIPFFIFKRNYSSWGSWQGISILIIVKQEQKGVENFENAHTHTHLRRQDGMCLP